MPMSTYSVVVEATDFEDAMAIATVMAKLKKTYLRKNTTEVLLINEKTKTCCPDCENSLTSGVMGAGRQIHCANCNKNIEL